MFKVNFMKKVLVIDDEPTIATLLADIIEEYGYEVTIAFDGRQGYELAKNGVYDLIISDIMMPFVSGNELCAKLKQQSKTQNTQVVLMSAVAHMAQLGTNCRADAFILKPFDIGVITRLIEQFLERPEAQPFQIPNPNYETKQYLPD